MKSILFYISFAFCTLFILNFSVTAQPVLVEDFTPGATGSVDEYNYAGVKYGESILFPITSPTLGRELGLLDMNGLKVLKDLNPGTESSDPANFILYKGRVFFTAKDIVNGRSIWSTDGTENGTKIEIDFPGSNNPFIYGLTISKSGKLYFIGSGNLYMYDGTNFKTITTLSDRFDFCTYENEIAFITEKNNGLALFVVENEVAVEKLAFANGVGFYPDIYGMNQVKGGIIVAVEQSSNDQQTATYLINANTSEVTKLFSGATKYAAKLQKFNDDKVLAAINKEGYYALDGTSEGNQLLYPASSFSFLQGVPVETVTYKDKFLFIANVDGFFGDDNLFYTDGTTSGTKISLQLESQYYSNLLKEGNYAFFADNTSNGFKPNIYSVNLDNGMVKKHHSSSLNSNTPESILMLGVLGKRLYFFSNLDPSKGRELYYLNLDLNITEVDQPFTSEGFEVKFYNTEFEISAANNYSVEVRTFSAGGLLLDTRIVETNTKYELVKGNTANFLVVTVNGQTQSKMYFVP